MRCEACGEDDASVHLTQLLNGEMKKLHLCKGCAAKHGINVDDPVSLTDLLFKTEGEEPEGTATDPHCPQCHMRLGDFRKTSRLGCPACYDAFRAELAPLLLGLHKHDLHAGKKPAGARLARDVKDREEALSRRLREAIAAERFEEAARLRDELKAYRDEGAS